MGKGDKDKDKKEKKDDAKKEKKEKPKKEKKGKKSSSSSSSSSDTSGTGSCVVVSDTSDFPPSTDTTGFVIEAEAGAFSAGVIERDALGGLPNNFTKEDFQSARGQTEITVALNLLKTFATDITTTPIDSLPPAFTKACFICCNSYTKPKYALGSGPINDSTTVAENHKVRGFDVYFIYNPTPARFMEVAGTFLQRTQQQLTIFFTGHGANVKDRTGDEDDGLDEAMVFDNGHIVDDDLLVLIKEKANATTKILLLTDCCHSGSIWDIQSAHTAQLQLPPNIFSISAAKDSQTAKQTKINKKDQGIFTYFFWKILNAKPKCSPAQMQPIINKGMQKFNQHFQVAVTSPNLNQEPIFA